MKGIVNHNAYAPLTIAETERAAKLHLILDIMLCYQLLKLLYYLTGAFDMAGASNTYSNLHKIIPHVYFSLFCLCYQMCKRKSQIFLL